MRALLQAEAVPVLTSETIHSLAMLEVKVVVATVLRAFTIEVPKNFDPNDMEPILAAVLRPKSEKCELVFRRVSSAS